MIMAKNIITTDFCDKCDFDICIYCGINSDGIDIEFK